MAGHSRWLVREAALASGWTGSGPLGSTGLGLLQPTGTGAAHPGLWLKPWTWGPCWVSASPV